MRTPSLKSNIGDQKVCKKKNLSCCLVLTEKSVRGSLFGITQQSLMMPNSDLWMAFSIHTTQPRKILMIYQESPTPKFFARCTRQRLFSKTKYDIEWNSFQYVTKCVNKAAKSAKYISGRHSMYRKNSNKHPPLPPPIWTWKIVIFYLQFLVNCQPIINAHWGILVEKDKLMI